MALHQLQIEGDAARREVRLVWPQATSTYLGAITAQVYDPVSGAILGEAEASEFAVEHAWRNAARHAGNLY